MKCRIPNTPMASWTMPAFVWLLMAMTMNNRAIGQPRELFFEKFIEKHGLSSNTIRNVLKDSRGYIWLATFGGLNRFDGYGFEAFTHYPQDSCSISNNTVHALAEDRHGNIWVGTNNGLNCYDPRTGCFKQYLHRPDDPNSLSHPTVTDVAEDAQGNIWVTTNGGGLNKLNPKTGTFRHFRADNDDRFAIAQDYALKVLIGADEKVWIGLGGNGLSMYDPQSEQFSNYRFGTPDKDPFQANVVRDIYEDDSGVLWLVTYKGMHRFDPKAFTNRYYLHDPDDPNTLPGNSLYAIKPDGEGGLWITTVNNGFCHYQPDTDIFTHYGTSKKTINLSANSFFDVYVDENRLWLGSMGKGLYKAEFPVKQYAFLSSKLFFPEETVNTTPQTGVEAPNGSILLSFWKKGIVAFDAGLWQAVEIPYLKPLNAYLKSLEINALQWTDDGRLWIGTNRDGLISYDTVTQTIEHYHSLQAGGVLSHRYISCIWPDDRGRLWIGTASGLNSLELSTGEVTTFPPKNDGPGRLKNGFITSFWQDSKGQMWVGTEGGLHLYHEKEGYFEAFNYQKEDTASISDNYVTAIREDRSGHLWIATQRGLNRLHEDDGNFRFERFDRKNGMQNDVVSGIVLAPDGKLWAATGQGITKFDPQTDRMEFFNLNNRLESNSFSNNIILPQNGKMLFCHNDLFVLFSPDSVAVSQYQPEVYITDFKVFNQSVSPESLPGEIDMSPKGALIPYTDQITVPYTSQFLSFEFTAIDYENPQGIEYAYRLEGFDDDWILAGNRRFASYTNLDPGRYTLQVKATNADGVWGKRVASLQLTVAPAFWQTWWFLLSVVLAIIVLLYFLHRFWLERALAMERLRVRIARDLHDDIGATLTKISLYADLMHEAPDANKNHQLLEKIASMGRHTLKSFSDIVWAIDARNDTVGNLINKVQDFALTLLSPQNIAVHFHKEGINPEASIRAERRQHLYLICKEALNNIAKHAEATKVEVHFLKRKDGYQVMIKDNGKGFDPARSAEMGNGLRNMKQRAQALGAQVEFVHQEGFSLIFHQVKLA